MRNAILFPLAIAVLACSGSAPESGTKADAAGADAKATGAAEAAGETGAAEDPEAAKVRACFDRMLDGLERFDKDAVLAELTGGKDEMFSAAVFLDYLVAGHAFEQSFRSAHGDEAWASFNGPEGASVQVAMPIDRTALGQAKVERDGDAAKLLLAGTGAGPSFRQVEGAWKLESASVFPHDATGEQRKVFARMAEALVAARPRAADPATDLDAFDRELGEALAAARQGPPGD